MFAWPAVCVGLFIFLPLEAAAIWSLLGGYLLLPSSFQIDLPLLPPIDKMTIAAVSAFLLCWMKGAQTRTQHPSTLIYLLSAGYVLAPILTSLGNGYELQTAAVSIPGFYPLDGLKFAGRQLISLLPFFIGMRFLSNDYGRALLLKSLPTALTIYSIPMLFEVRMSPQLHQWVYGYFPTTFNQQIRAGGFRPVVFLSHGLELALITTLAIIAAVIGAHARWRILRLPAGAVAAYLSVILYFCKSLAPIVYAVVVAPIVLFTRPRFWVKISCAILLFVSAYPALRTSGVIPVQAIASAANFVSTDRSVSFQMRVRNEEALLSKANQKPFFGWGTWGRNRIFDRDTGQDISVTDGQWVIVLGTFGWFGYLCLFLLLTTAAFRSLRVVGKTVTTSTIELGGLTLLLAVYVLDLLPNANTMSLTFLIAGSIATSVKAGVRKTAAPTKSGELRTVAARLAQSPEPRPT